MRCAVQCEFNCHTVTSCCCWCTQLYVDLPSTFLSSVCSQSRCIGKLLIFFTFSLVNPGGPESQSEIGVSNCAKLSYITNKTIFGLYSCVSFGSQNWIWHHLLWEFSTPLNQFFKHDPKRNIWTKLCSSQAKMHRDQASYRKTNNNFRDWPSLVRMVLTMNTWLPTEEELTVEEVWVWHSLNI